MSRARRAARNDGALAGTKKGELAFALFDVLAEWTGLEPATPGVTGRYSNQLNYHSRNRATLVGADGIEPPTFAL
jgi:hypothetical protein